ncbi:SDR family NAD(P)-dependent oxidoreductase [Thermopolyspora sp. NPDC052614]|uniref:SDR family NAD(P)-dependent oxidoreductase n=1 Tax=Thermopolyspora sp. NPDC052614 TaxID=3155682 RepID=UPI00344529CA
MTSPGFVAPELVDDVLAAARGIPGVRDAVAVVRRRAWLVGRAPADRPTRPAEPDPAPRAPAELHGGPVRIPAGAPATLQEALRAAAERAPGKGTVYIRRDRDDVLQTYPELLAEAERVLAGLRVAGLRPGDAALFVFDDNRCFLTAFWACVLGGFVPTPVAVATTYDVPNEVTRKLHNAWRLLGRPALLTDAATAGALAGVRDLWGEPDVRLHTVEELLTHPPDHDPFPAAPQDPVLNLLTSGSTGVPKCVQHTNAGLLARTFAVAEHRGLTAEDVGLIWMPLDHVTVAMYNVRDLILGCLHVNAKIDHFLSDPLLWLDWMDRYRVTNTWAPNFAFSLVNELAAEIRGRSWDLSRVREIVNAGEPVIASTSHRFLDLLAPHGLRADAVTPCWGMSETCSGVTYTRQSRDDRTAGTVAIDPATLGGSIRHLSPRDEKAVVLSTVGRPIPGVRLRVVGEDGSVLPEGRVGELRVAGATMMRGYFGNDEANAAAYDENGWFRTGDLAFVCDGEVVIAGRIKDQIIVRGVNHLAHEIESVVERVDGVRVTFVAAAGLRDPGESTDKLVIFFVPERRDPAAADALVREIRAVLGREAGLVPDVLVPVTPEEFPKTASGKIQRAALVKALRAGAFADRVFESEPAAEPDAWLVRRQWVELPPPEAEAPRTGTCLVVGEDAVLGLLAPDGAVVAVRDGHGPGRTTPGRHRVAAGRREDVRRLLATVTERHGPLSSVVLALPEAAEGDDPVARLTAATAEVTAFAGELATQEYGRPLLLVLTAGAVHAAEADAVDLGTCALPALIRTAADEAAPAVVRQVDLPPERREWREAVRVELADRLHAGVVAVRQGRRLWPRLVPVDDEIGADAGPPVVPGGLYLVTGGLGGIAHEICGHLLAAYGVRLVLVGRSRPEGERGRRLADLAALGEVEYHLLDVAKPGLVEAAVKTAEARWQRPIDGVLHLAGEDPTGQWADLDRHTIARESATTYAEHYRAKVAGTLSVARVLESRPDASLVLFGSVNGEFGGHSFGAYAAANGFLVGFADHWRHERRRTVHCLGWSMWTGVGMNRSQPTAAARRRGFRPIDPAHGLRLFLAAVTAPHHYLLVGLDLANPAIVNELAPDRLRVGELLVAYTGDQVEPGQVRAALAPAGRRCPVPLRVVRVPRIVADRDGGVDATRLLLDAERAGRTTAEPVTELERRIAGIWSEALNRPVVGRDDSFFDLGGDSLRAARLLALVDRRLSVRLTSRELYTAPTVAGMAAAIAEAYGGGPAKR